MPVIEMRNKNNNKTAFRPKVSAKPARKAATQHPRKHIIREKGT